jgi:acetylornithine deacetylase
LTAAEILRELVAIASPSSVSNLPLLGWVASFLAERHWQVEVLPYLDDSGLEKANLIAWPGSGGRPDRFELVFVCHTDTVPYAKDWAGALRVEEREGNLHGCGSCDVKGALACFLAAISHGSGSHPSDKIKDVARVGHPNCVLDPTSQSGDVGHPDFSSSGLIRSVGLILTADEEIGCKGMERLLASVDLRIGSAMVSEPTSLQAGIAGKGYGLARVTVEGREAHSAFPAKGVSAISAAARLIVRIEEAFAQGAQVRPEDAGVDPLFDPPRTTLNIGVMEGGTAKNIVPGRCTFLVEWRPIPAEPPGTVLGTLERLASEAALADPRVGIRVEGLRDEPGFSPATGGPLRRRLDAVLGARVTGISFGSEASRLARIAEEVIVIGPGDMRTAHSDRECVPVAEVERWTEVLRDLIGGW